LLTLVWLLRDWHQPVDPLDRAWRRFVRRVGRAGLAKSSAEPALAWADRVAARLPDAVALLSLSRRYSDARYARRTATADEQANLIRDLHRFRMPPGVLP